MPQIPDRWIPYKACGNIIDGTRIVCFKVPLKKSVQLYNKDIKKIWDIPAVLSEIPILGAVIDLTNTTRYYNPKEFMQAGVLYKKILMPGRIIPPENKVVEFINAVDEFLRNDNERILGVHCTHGLNRTGYMVCRYMRDVLGIPAKQAIKSFEKARGYQIERQNYIEDLLGKDPSAPDLGKNATIKPTKKKKHEEDEHIQEEEHVNNVRTKKPRHRKNKMNKDGECKRDCRRTADHSDNAECNRIGYDKRKKNLNAKQKKRRRASSETSFDYRYDY